MSQENVERTRRFYDAINRGDLEAGLALAHPEGEFNPRLLGVEGGDTYRGHDGVREWWQSIFSAFPDFNATVFEVRAVAWTNKLWRVFGSITFKPRAFRHAEDGRVVVPADVTTIARRSGVPIDIEVAGVFTLRNDKISRLEVFDSKDEALEAAGLSG